MDAFITFRMFSLHDYLAWWGKRPPGPEWPTPGSVLRAQKKADTMERPQAFDRAGLLVNGPPDAAGLPFS